MTEKSKEEQDKQAKAEAEDIEFMELLAMLYPYLYGPHRH